ncbi:NXPE3 [Branchiostoma lanceolatum]|uniref:NXPE3 protein n=1 Tax=Branchiostoma lanceolatum TaxID=7740 RepID=A0A8K0EXD7_BRALA|nr:NXPE3 [Branchiostoma lanceolatum]
MRGTSNAQMANLTWWQVLKRVLIGSVILTTGAEFLTTLMVRSSGWVLSPRHFHFSAPKPKAKVITVTSLGTWRTSNQSINLDWVTDPKQTSVKIINSKPTYHVGDTLVLEVIARDGNKQPKVYGGDYLRAVLRDKAQKASTTGRVRDHRNGRYTVRFLLSFPGRVTPEVQLIHPSEAVQLLRELREIPNKRRWTCAFKGKRRRDVETKCTLLANQFISLSSQCDFSVLNTSRTWFCEKPKKTSCDKITKCKSSLDTVAKLMTSQEERKLFESPFFRRDLAPLKIGAIVIFNVDAEPTHVYRSRMYEVRSAIKELHKKYPETTVIVKTCNTRHHRHYREVIQASDWLADQLNQEMRSILGDLNVAILDVWDMTVSQWYAQDLHPDVHVVDNELNILMSYIQARG